MTKETEQQAVPWKGGSKLDWRKIANAAGRHGVRYRTNTALERFLSEIVGDANQTREAELVALADKLCEGRDGTQPGLMGAYRQGVRDLAAALSPQTLPAPVNPGAILQADQSPLERSPKSNGVRALKRQTLPAPEAILRAALDKIRRRTSITFGSGTMSAMEAFGIASEALRTAYNGGGYGQTPKGMKPWEGGPINMPPHDWRVGCTVKYRDGTSSKGATEYKWDHTGGPGDIVSYEPCDLATWVPEPMGHRCETCGVKDGHALGCPENEPPYEEDEAGYRFTGWPITGMWFDEAENLPLTCERPPRGWRCTRVPGHDGPCACVPDSVARGIGYGSLVAAVLWVAIVAVACWWWRK